MRTWCSSMRDRRGAPEPSRARRRRGTRTTRVGRFVRNGTRRRRIGATSRVRRGPPDSGPCWPSRWSGPLDADEVRAVAALVEAATEADGVRPAVRARDAAPALRRRHSGSATCWSGWATQPARLRTPRRHRRGRGAERRGGGAPRRTGGAASGRLLVADHPGRDAGRPAAAVGARRAPGGGRAGRRRWASSRSRALWQMRRSLYAAAARAPTCRDGVTVRTFEPGQRRRGVGAAQRGGLRDHPEQGGVDRGRPAPADARAVVRPGGLLPRRAGRRRGSSASTGPRCTAADGPRPAPPTRTTPDGPRPRPDRRGLRRRGRPRRAGHRARPGADARRAAAPAPPRAARRDAVRRRGQRRGDPALHRAGLHPLGDRRDVQP